MKITLNLKSAELAWDAKGWNIKLYLCEKSDKAAAESFLSDMKPEKPYAAVIGEVTKQRSMDANRYAWVLLDKLSEKLNLPAVEIYRNTVKDVGGVSEILAIPDAAVDTFRRNWESHGIGWPCVVIGAAQYPVGYTLVNAFYGSSTYDTKQMAHLIDLIVQECKEQGIETMTPDEIAKLKGITDDE